MRLAVSVTLLLAAMLPWPARAGGPLGIDHLVSYDNSGIWSRQVQLGLAKGVAVTTVGGALLLPHESRLGRTFAQSLDSMVLSAGTVQVAKYAFSRARPYQDPNPDRFFSGRGHVSFPSGEVAQMASVVTPFIAEYGSDHPAFYMLALLPAYDAIARVKTHGHWQSDVLAGAAVGVAWGLYAHSRTSPLIIGLLPGRGLQVGYARPL